jgi:hypothetical protein
MMVLGVPHPDMGDAGRVELNVEEAQRHAETYGEHSPT